MTDEELADRINRAPHAHWVHVYYCDGPECNRPHVVLFDHDDMPMAQFVVPDGFMKRLQDALYRSAVERGDPQ